MQEQKHMLYHIQTYGCQMNEHDSEVLAGILEQSGYSKASDASEADVILVNTCCVRESAEQRILGELGRLNRHKHRRQDVLIGVCGCMVMNEDSREKIRRRASHVDFVLGPNQLHRLPEFIEQSQKEDSNRDFECDLSGNDVLPTELPRRRVEGVRAWVPIIYGCNNFCTYCIVPYVRGRERSRPLSQIVSEIEKLVDEGIKEVTLLGQNVNSYGKDMEQDIDFGDLLRETNEIEGLKWIRYTTSHPRDFSTELVDRMRDFEKVCEHFHLPVQSGSDRILQKMNRGYTREQYLDLINHIREVFPDSSVTTDVIVGFPGESERDFEDTYTLFEKVRFDNAFSFMYSPRSGTRAAEFEDQIPDEVKKERLHRLNELQHSVAEEKNKKREGKKLSALVIGPSSKDPQVYEARSRTNKLILLQDAEQFENEFAKVKIYDAGSFHLRGEIIENS